MVWKRECRISLVKFSLISPMSKIVFAVGDVLARRSGSNVLDSTVNVSPGSSASFI